MIITQPPCRVHSQGLQSSHIPTGAYQAPTGLQLLAFFHRSGLTFGGSGL